MNRLSRTPFLWAACWLAAACATPGCDVGPAPARETVVSSSLAVRDAQGVVRRPLQLGASRAAVLLFVGIECPISNAYAPEINRLCNEFRTKDVAFYLVYCDRDVTADAVRAHATAYGFDCPQVLDAQHALVNRLGATVTPQAIVVGPGEQVLYRGRIDNVYYGLGKRRFDATEHDLRDAVEAIFAGRAVLKPVTPAVGCAIS